MATDFVMPRFPNNQQQPQLQQTFRGFHNNPSMNRQQPPPQQVSTGAPYQPSAQHNGNGNSQQISPLSTSGNVSPTSPKTLTRQIRPLYMPAALRPNQYASKPPTSRPSSKDEEIEEEERKLKPNPSYIGRGALGRLSRRNTGDSAMCIDPHVNLDHYPKPTGMPTRKHWKPDAESTVCDDARCKKNFNYFTRRHHCRRCGNIFCDVHSAFEIPLDQDANYNPRGTPSRACQHCYSQFKEWRSRANSQSSTSGSSTSDGNTTSSEPDSPVLASPITPTGIKVGFNLGLPSMPEVAHSVPRDWNWSTF